MTLVLMNWRRHPRVRIRCDVSVDVNGRRWQSATKDISLGGCRIAGYFPFPVGTQLPLEISHVDLDDRICLRGHVAQLYGGLSSAIGVAFEQDKTTESQLQRWLNRLLVRDFVARRTVTNMPQQIPVNARLERVPFPSDLRSLSAAEVDIVTALDQQGGPKGVFDLRSLWGADWERRGQALFELVADGILVLRPYEGTLKDKGRSKPPDPKSHNVA
jgi:hypothetical protein